MSSSVRLRRARRGRGITCLAPVEDCLGRVVSNPFKAVGAEPFVGTNEPYQHGPVMTDIFEPSIFLVAYCLALIQFRRRHESHPNFRQHASGPIQKVFLPDNNHAVTF